MHHRPLVFIDIETTGGRSDQSRIIDIGAIRVENGKVVAQMNQLLNPSMRIPTFITRLTGIRDDMVWNQPTFNDIAEELETLLNGAVFVAHNVDFDYGFIKSEFERMNVEFHSDRACTVRLSRLLQPEFRRHGLDKIIDRMTYTVVNRHRGYDDAEVLQKYFLHFFALDPVHTLKALSRSTTYMRKKRGHLPDHAQLALWN